MASSRTASASAVATRCPVFSWSVPDFPSFAPMLGMVLGLGAGIDYALLIVGRYRERLASGDSVSLSGVPCARWKRRTSRNVAKTPSAAMPNGRCRRRTAPPGEHTTAFARPGVDSRISVSHSRRWPVAPAVGCLVDSATRRVAMQCSGRGERGPRRSQAFAS